jgi:hypothetical protein
LSQQGIWRVSFSEPPAAEADESLVYGIVVFSTLPLAHADIRRSLFRRPLPSFIFLKNTTMP